MLTRMIVKVVSASFAPEQRLSDERHGEARESVTKTGAEVFDAVVKTLRAGQKRGV